jgi:hypothetical protein
MDQYLNGMEEEVIGSRPIGCMCNKNDLKNEKVTDV